MTNSIPEDQIPEMEDMDCLSARCPNLFMSFRQHYRKMRKRGAMWVDAPGSGFVSDSSEAAFQSFLSQFTKEEVKLIRQDVDTKPQETQSSITKRIAALLENMAEDEVRKLLEAMK